MLPGRAGFLTGKYPARLRLTKFISGHLKAKLPDFPYTDQLPRENPDYIPYTDEY